MTEVFYHPPSGSLIESVLAVLLSKGTHRTRFLSGAVDARPLTALYRDNQWHFYVDKGVHAMTEMEFQIIKTICYEKARDLFEEAKSIVHTQHGLNEQEALALLDFFFQALIDLTDTAIERTKR